MTANTYQLFKDFFEIYENIVNDVKLFHYEFDIMIR